ncbi:predicted protein [Streptomyces viridosporus ATCC 14672]|uniref:Predicted protein n=1 Tax=Streptomyces viridosporus (strain ATCC 14672 / DSM 40746 / JCM 4963 / KCTC 9882 / NRRL B-12104 / FH 1290) TaxID=566461 RepID=D6A1K2_STRV1|nr:predicted protein [Streptomyces viridosporus ATCC 14672]
MERAGPKLSNRVAKSSPGNPRVPELLQVRPVTWVGRTGETLIVSRSHRVRTFRKFYRNR